MNGHLDGVKKANKIGPYKIVINHVLRGQKNMDVSIKSSRRLRLCVTLLGAGILLISGFAARAHATDYQSLPVVKPVMTCDQLANADVSKAVGAKVTVKSAKILDTAKGPYCRVLGDVEPSISFIVDLPTEHWTQRFLQGAQQNERIERAGSCMPALNGEIAIATDDMGHSVAPAGSPWGMDPTRRIDWAYLGNHMTAVTSKALIKVFYGQSQKFAYFVGCSEGGRESLEEAQRYPEDFDGVSAGAPVVYDSVHNLPFWHGWEYHADQRADGSIVMTKARLTVLHQAVLAHCAAVSGMLDGVLQQPTACKFDKSWVQCAADLTDTSNCLTIEEANVAEQLYLGPNDGKNMFEVSGWPLGSELQWRVSTPGKPADGEALSPNGLHRTLMPPLSGESTKDLVAKFTFTQDWFDKTMELAPLMNAANTNLRPFQSHGDKLILWQGAEDTTVQPAVSISYYEGVQKELGAKTTESFMRFFLLPGVGHCGNGEGPSQVDVLTPLMAWVEMQKAPAMIVAGKTVQSAAPGGGPGPGGPNTPGQGQGGPGGQNDAGPRPQFGAAGVQGPFGARGPFNVYAEPGLPVEYTRPIYPFPNVAKYSGKGDPKVAANYKPVKSSLKVPEVFSNETAKLLGPNNQKFYHEENGQLVEDARK